MEFGRRKGDRGGRLTLRTQQPWKRKQQLLVPEISQSFARLQAIIVCWLF